MLGVNCVILAWVIRVRSLDHCQSGIDGKATPQRAAHLGNCIIKSYILKIRSALRQYDGNSQRRCYNRSNVD